MFFFVPPTTGVLEAIRDTSQLTMTNSALLDAVKRLEGYMFSKRIRKRLFTQNEAEVTQQVQDRIRSLHIGISGLLRRVKLRSTDIDKTAIFHQDRQYLLAKRFIHNALANTAKAAMLVESIERSMREIVVPRNTMQQVKTALRALKACLEENKVLLDDVNGRLRLEAQVIGEYEDLKKTIIRKKDLRVGDILLGYYSQKLLWTLGQAHTKIIEVVTKSQVDHATVCVSSNTDRPKIVEATGKGLLMKELHILKGEVYLVVRPRLSARQRQMLMRKIREYPVGSTEAYAYGKVAGMLPAILARQALHLFTKGYSNVSNPFDAARAKVFCSEFVDRIFAEIGFPLTPKSGKSSMVAPADIATTPRADPIGILMEETDEAQEQLMNILANAKA